MLIALPNKFQYLDMSTFLTRVIRSAKQEFFLDSIRSLLQHNFQQQKKLTMKTLSSTIIILCTVAFTSFGATKLSVKEAPKANVFNIEYQSTEKGKVEVSILNNKNETIYSEVISNLSSFVRPYNFSSLPEGEYTIAIKDENGTHTQKVNHSFDKVINYTYVGAVPNQENKYWLNIYNNGQETVNVRIINADGIVLFEQSVVVEGNYTVVYDLTKVKKNAAVTFEVTDGNDQIHSTTF